MIGFTDAFDKSLIIFGRQEDYLIAIARRGSIAGLIARRAESPMSRQSVGQHEERP